MPGSTQVSLLVLTLTGTVAAIWAANRFVLDNTTAGTGWVVMIGSPVGLVTLGLVIRHLYSSMARAPPGDDSP